MYKHELYKIYSKKSIYVVLLLTILTIMYASNHSADMVMKDPIYEELHETWGGPITDEKVIAASEIMVEADSRAPGDPSAISSEERHASNVHFFVASAGQNAEALNEHKIRLHTNLEKMESSTYDYKEMSKELSMLEDLGEPNGFYLIRAWRGMLTLIDPFFGTLFLSALILIGLTPIFSEEFTQRTAGLIAATKHGKKRIVTAKIMAGTTYVLSIFMVLHFINFLIQSNIHGGFEGWDAPIQSFIDGSTYSTIYQYSPYNWDVLKLYVMTLSIQLFAAVAFSILVLFISSMIKNTMIAFFLSGSILVGPFILSQLGLERLGLFSFIKSFSYLELFKVQELFDAFKAYNVFGNPVLYPVLILVIYIILSIGILLFTYYGISKQQIHE